MSSKDYLFYLNLGEIWYNFLVIEFLARAIISKIDGQEKLFPIPPYKHYKQYGNYPDSFKTSYFSDVADELNSKLGNILIKKEQIDLRNALAHGVLATFESNTNMELVKFKKSKKSNRLYVSYHLKLSDQVLEKTAKEIRELRFELMEKFNDVN